MLHKYSSSLRRKYHDRNQAGFPLAASVARFLPGFTRLMLVLALTLLVSALALVPVPVAAQAGAAPIKRSG